MTNGVDINQLRQYIQHDSSFEAEEFVKRHPAESEPVLAEFSQSSNTDVRRIVVELAGTSPSPHNCRLLLNGLSDADLEIKEISIASISRCRQPELVPELVGALKQHQQADVLSALVLVIGQLGSTGEIKPLRKLRAKRGHEAGLDHDLSIALARLGDTVARDELQRRLVSNSDAADRVAALNDCLYVGDQSLVAHFGPALDDGRDMVALSIPENPPMEYARVADIAVHVMAQLGVQFSFPLEELMRLNTKQLDEAKKRVLSFKGQPAS